MILEKNDVDISKLFVWGKRFDILNAQDEIVATVYMRLLGDADVNRARVFALRKSAELRKSLQDKDSTERMIYVRELEELTKQDLLNYIIMFSMREITNQAYKEVRVKRPTQPKAGASLEKMEKYQKELDDYPDKLKKAVQDYIKKEVDKLTKALESEDDEALYKRYLKNLTEEYCEQEAFRAYKDIELYLGCYKDENYKIRFFDSFEEFENLDTQTKMDFRAAYETLDVKMDDLKKLREATQ